MRNQKDKITPHNPDDRTKDIIVWINKIEKSKFPIQKFFENHPVPFSRSQYYLYSKGLKEFGQSGLRDKRSEGGNKKLTPETEAFIAGCVESNPEVSPKWIQEALNKNFGFTLTPSGITRVLQRLNLVITLFSGIVKKHCN